MNKKIKISSVSYLNAKPFVYGLKHSDIISKIELSEDSPAACAEKLLSGQADIGLVPIAILPQLKSADVISDFCIGADGPVRSVILFSEVPLQEIKNVMLDYQSKTSVQLVRILAHNFWKISPAWIDTKVDYEKKISGNTAGVVIGDRTFTMKGKFPFEYDLAGEWKKFTGLPFVFACWVSLIKPEDSFLKDFNHALSFGLKNIKEVSKTYHDPAFAEDYLSNFISFNLDDKKRQAMKLFLELEEQNVIARGLSPAL